MGARHEGSGSSLGVINTDEKLNTNNTSSSKRKNIVIRLTWQLQRVCTGVGLRELHQHVPVIRIGAVNMRFLTNVCAQNVSRGEWESDL